ncbi:MAG: Xaa-Pro peptidase family protein [Candidatus Caldarchaeum sp.]|nr:Xaa-Pro peptidase family protein [Candidatus Caldarchaeum sp.]
MISELDDLMAKSGYDALLVLGESTYSSAELYYLVRAPVPRGGVYLKKRGSEPQLVVSTLDAACARKGIVSDVKTYSDYGLGQLQRRFGPGRAYAELIATVLKRAGVSGQVAVAGKTDALTTAYLVDFLRRRGFRVAGMPRPSFLDLCRRKKEKWEAEAVVEAGRRTVKVVEKLEKILEYSDVRQGRITYEGKPLTTGFLRRSVMAWCGEEGLTLPEGLILASGPDSSDPHASGLENKPLNPGEPLLFDIFPASEKGYRYDFTRTYCVGRPKPLLRRMFQDVLEAQTRAFEVVGEGVRCGAVFAEACRVLQRRGWPTLLEARSVDRGFIHGLGHGVGLTIGEEPYLSRDSQTVISTGDVFTVEPGLYEPGFGGVRIEDVAMIEGGKTVKAVEHRYVLEF